MVRLVPVTRENLEEVLRLKVRPGQEKYVSTVAESLSQAYVYRDTAFPFAVYDGDTAVGFIMLGYYEKKGYYTLWKLLIGQEFQHRGYGRRALELGLTFLKDTHKADRVYTGVTPGNDTAKALYLSMGFAPTGLTENNMEELCVRLP